MTYPYFSSNFLRYPLAYLAFLFTISAQAQQYVSTYAGTGTKGFKNGPVAEATFRDPFGIAIDKKGNLFIAENGNNCIRKIGTDGIVSTYAGTGTAGYKDGPRTEAQFNAPTGLWVDDDGTIYVSDFLNHRIRKIDSSGMVTTIAGSGEAGLLDTTIALSAKFNYPRGVCRDKAGNLYVGDSWNHRIRKISTTGEVTTYAGGGKTIGVQSVGSYKDAADTSARFYTPCEVKIDKDDNIYVADAYNHRIRKIDKSRMVTTVAGSGNSGQNTGDFNDGPANEARFNTPTTVFADEDGIIYMGDGLNHRVRKIDTTGIVSTFAGIGYAGFEDGPDSIAQFDFPRGVTKNFTTGDFYVVDFNNSRIRKISKDAPEGIERFNKGDRQLYPNPSSGFFFVEGAEETLSMHVLDLLGQPVLADEGSIAKNSINICYLPAGIYFVKMTEGGKTMVKKIVKK